MKLVVPVPEVKFSEGDLVKYQNATYFLSELKGERAILIPIEAISFEDLTLDLTKAKLVSLKYIKKI